MIRIAPADKCMYLKRFSGGQVRPMLVMLFHDETVCLKQIACQWESVQRYVASWSPIKGIQSQNTN